MIYKYNFDGTAEGQATVVAEHANMTLVEIQDITEGHFLVFDDGQNSDIIMPQPQDLLAKVQALEKQNVELKEQNLTVMAALADMYDAIKAITPTE